MFFNRIDEQIFSIYHSKILLKENIEDSSKVMDPELFKRFDHRITRCRTKLYKDYPWFGVMLTKLKTVPTFDIPTMAVDDFGNIYMNPEFTLKITEDQTMGVLAHECMHIMTLSFFRQKSRDGQWWNIATDFIMNMDLVEMNMSLPEGGCIPEKRGDSFFAVIPGAGGNPVLEVDITNMNAEQLYHEFEKEVEKQEKNKKSQPGPKKQPVYKPGDRVQSKTTGKNGTIKNVQGTQPGKQTLEIEWDNEVNEALEQGIVSSDVMPLLSGKIEMEQSEDGLKEGEDFALDKGAEIIQKPSSAKPKNSKTSTGKSSSSTPNQNPKDAKIKGDLKKILDELAKKRENFDKHITSGQTRPAPLETPTGDDDYKPNTEKDKATAENKLKDKVQSTITALQQRGQGAGGPRSLTKKILATKTNWKGLLRNFLSGMEKTKPTWTKVNKRAFASGYYAPGLKKEKTKLEVVVALDTSGSISDNTIALFASEILNIVRTFPKVKMKIILWHSNVYADIDLDGVRSSLGQITDALHSLPYEGGGTTLSSVKDYIDSKYPNKKFTGLIVFTDGYIEDNPRLINAQNKLFLIVEGGSKQILEKFGSVHEIDVHH